MRPPPPRLAALSAVVCTAVVCVGCDNSSSTAERHGTATSSVATVEVHNADDLTFVRSMLTHHRQAAQLLTLASTNTTNPQVIAVAQQIGTDHQLQAQAFTAWMLQWGEDPHNYPGMDDRAPGIVDQAIIGSLQTLRGPEFDKPWLRSMITSSRGVVQIAQAEVAHGQNPDTITMAKSVVASEQSRVDKMQLLAS